MVSADNRESRPLRSASIPSCSTSSLGHSNFASSSTDRVRVAHESSAEADGSRRYGASMPISRAGSGDARRSYGRLAFARLIPETGSLFSINENLVLLQSAIRAGTAAERHGREWRMGQHSVDEAYLYGRLGFMHAHAPTEVWSDTATDFVDEAFPSGFTSPFAVRISDLVVAFQLRSGHIKRQSFAGALQALMRTASGDAWQVVPMVRPITFERWRASVSRVTTMSFKLQPPNPNYKGRPLVQSVIKGAGADMVTFVLRAGADDLAGLDTEAEFLRQAVSHAEKGYGKFAAVGERTDDGGKASMVHFDGDAGESAVVQVAVDPETGEVAHETLRDEIAERPAELEQESDEQAK